MGTGKWREVPCFPLSGTLRDGLPLSRAGVSSQGNRYRNKKVFPQNMNWSFCSCFNTTAVSRNQRECVHVSGCLFSVVADKPINSCDLGLICRQSEQGCITDPV